MKGKRGFEMAISTIVIIVLGLLLLAGLIFLLSYQTNFFSSIIHGIQGKSNIDAAIQGCNSFVTSNQVYEYCCVKKKVIFGSSTEEVTCDELFENPLVSGRISSLDCESQNCE